MLGNRDGLMVKPESEIRATRRFTFWSLNFLSLSGSLDAKLILPKPKIEFQLGPQSLVVTFGLSFDTDKPPSLKTSAKYRKI